MSNNELPFIVVSYGSPYLDDYSSAAIERSLMVPEQVSDTAYQCD